MCRVNYEESLKIECPGMTAFCTQDTDNKVTDRQRGTSGASGAIYSLGLTLSGPKGKQKPPRACAGGKLDPESVTLCGSTKLQKSSTFRLFSTATRATKQFLNMPHRSNQVSLVR